nr:uncharacterized protein LOC129163491 [Nothobranchius furzeri]
MDLGFQGASRSSSHAQLLEQTSNGSSLDHWSSTLEPGPPKHEVWSISSLVPFTVLTLMPTCEPAVSGNPSSFFQPTSNATKEPETPEASSFGSESQTARDLTFLTSSLGVNPAEVPPSGLVEERSIDLIIPKELNEKETEARTRNFTTREWLALVGVPVVLVTIATALLVKFLVFPSNLDVSSTLNPVGTDGFLSQLPYLFKFPGNQTGNITTDCQTAASDGRRIVGGTLAAEDQWGWQVSMQWRGSHICGGSIISARWIITAAHCFVENSMFEPSDWLVLVGTLSIARNSQGKRYRALQVFYHPQYNKNSYDYDVGLLRTITDIGMTDGVRPVCLPRENDSFPLGTPCWITGWGTTQEGGDSYGYKKPHRGPVTSRRQELTPEDCRQPKSPPALSFAGGSVRVLTSLGEMPIHELKP